MATSQLSEIIQHLHRAVLREGAGLTDGQLLENYLNHRDDAALAALVGRHAPLIWGVCRRILRSHHDAEDAFQACFLVLVRKAASIDARELLANWLYGVAYLTAIKARAMVRKRKARDRPLLEMPEPEAPQRDLWHDLQPLLDQELSRLPDLYRRTIVLCDLEGKTRKQAAEQLDCPEGTVAGRLARARALLASRLARHGLTMSAGSLVTALAREVEASVPPSVVSSTIKAATLFAAGQGLTGGGIPANLITLTEGVLKTMVLTRLKTITWVVLIVVLGVAAFGGFLVNHRVAGQEARGQDPKASKAAEPAKGEPQELLTVGKRYNFLVSGNNFNAKVVEKRSDGWIKVQITIQVKPGENRPKEMWLNLQQVSMFDDWESIP
jgi:RNA polymerase sigma factor (sigma-70 family)